MAHTVSALPQSRSASVLRPLAVAFAGSMLIAICAHIAVPMPFTPVPMTLQTLAVILVGMVSGPAAGFAACAMYLLEGLCGMPVFAPGGLGGVLQMTGLTGGFLLSYPFAAALSGWLYRRDSSRPFVSGFAAGAAGIAVILTLGAVWFGVLTHLSAKAVLAATVLPFLAGEAAKIVCAAGIAKALPNLRR